MPRCPSSAAWRSIAPRPPSISCWASSRSRRRRDSGPGPGAGGRGQGGRGQRPGLDRLRHAVGPGPRRRAGLRRPGRRGRPRRRRPGGPQQRLPHHRLRPRAGGPIAAGAGDAAARGRELGRRRRGGQSFPGASAHVVPRQLARGVGPRDRRSRRKRSGSRATTACWSRSFAASGPMASTSPARATTMPPWPLFEEGLALAERVGDINSVPRYLNSLAWLLSECGDYDRALEMFGAAAERARKWPHAVGVEIAAYCEVNRGDVFLDKGDLTLAAEFLEQGAPHRRGPGHVPLDEMALRHAPPGQPGRAGPRTRGHRPGPACSPVRPWTSRPAPTPASISSASGGCRARSRSRAGSGRRRSTSSGEPWPRRRPSATRPSSGGATRRSGASTRPGRTATPLAGRSAPGVAIVESVKAGLQRPELRAGLERPPLVRQLYSESGDPG